MGYLSEQEHCVPIQLNSSDRLCLNKTNERWRNKIIWLKLKLPRPCCVTRTSR